MSIDDIKTIIKEKVRGVYEPRHDSSGHKYLNTKTGVLQKSVTTKLSGTIPKPHLTRWAVKMGIEWLEKEDRFLKLSNESWREEMISGAQMAHLDVRDDAGGVGHQAHEAIEKYILSWLQTGVKPTDIRLFAPLGTDPRAIASMRAVEAFLSKNDVQPIATELLVGDDKYSAGTLDFLAIMNGKLTLLDWKTSNAVDQISYSLQVAAYKYFFESMTGLKIKQCKILHLSKDYDRFDVWKINNINKAWFVFKQLCSAYDWMYGQKDKIVKDIRRISI